MTYYDGPIVSKRIVEKMVTTSEGKSFLHHSELDAINGSLCHTGAQYANDSKDSKLNNLSIARHSQPEHKGYYNLNASKDIEPDTELTWCYGKAYWKHKFSTDTQEAHPEIIFPDLHNQPPRPHPHAIPRPPIGTIIYSKSNTEILIQDVFVEEAHRKKGTLRELLNRLICLNPKCKTVNIIIRKIAKQQEVMRNICTKYNFKHSKKTDGGVHIRNTQHSPNTSQIHMKVSAKYLEMRTRKRDTATGLITDAPTTIQTNKMEHLYDSMKKHHKAPNGDKHDIDTIIRRADRAMLAFNPISDPPIHVKVSTADIPGADELEEPKIIEALLLCKTDPYLYKGPMSFISYTKKSRDNTETLYAKVPNDCLEYSNELTPVEHTRPVQEPFPIPTAQQTTTPHKTTSKTTLGPTEALPFYNLLIDSNQIDDTELTPPATAASNKTLTPPEELNLKRKQNSDDAPSAEYARTSTQHYPPPDVRPHKRSRRVSASTEIEVDGTNFSCSFFTRDERGYQLWCIDSSIPRQKSFLEGLADKLWINTDYGKTTENSESFAGRLNVSIDGKEGQDREIIRETIDMIKSTHGWSCIAICDEEIIGIIHALPAKGRHECISMRMIGLISCDSHGRDHRGRGLADTMWNELQWRLLTTGMTVAVQLEHCTVCFLDLEVVTSGL